MQTQTYYSWANLAALSKQTKPSIPILHLKWRWCSPFGGFMYALLYVYEEHWINLRNSIKRREKRTLRSHSSQTTTGQSRAENQYILYICWCLAAAFYSVAGFLSSVGVCRLKLALRELVNASFSPVRTCSCFALRESVVFSITSWVLVGVSSV